jgi:integrating conjugative element protein (TIGR03752 family)
MANKVRTNRMPWMIAAVLLVVVFVVAINTQTSSPSVPAGSRAPDAPATPTITDSASGDTTEETLRTVQAQYGDLRRELKQRDDQIATLKETVTDMSTDKGEEINSALADQLSQLEQKVNSLKVGNFSMDNQGAVLKDFGFNTPGSASGSEDPVDYKINGESFAFGNTSPTYEQTTSVEGRPSYRRLKPLSTGSEAPRPSQSLASTDSDSSLPQFSNPMSSGEPVYTIPARATLFDATSMTALIGRVPIGGQVQDPFPVKLIVGSDNMAANGHQIPGLDGVIFDGVARGDWSLSCVSVELTGATYVFDDGTINHMPPDKTVSADALGASFGEGQSSKNIGYISDRQGVPCIAGKRITDAYKQASLMTILGAAQGYSKYRADSLRTTGVDGGTVISSVTGDRGEYGEWGLAASGLDKTIDIFEERFQDTFDAIYVAPGQEVAIHVARDLHINHNKNARRVSYESLDSPNSFN